jgi:lipid-binding SYLF domain-containing protein
MMKLDDQLKFDLASECDKTEKILRGFLTQSPDTDLGKRRVNVIPNEVVQRAKGFAVFTVIKGGLGL